MAQHKGRAEGADAAYSDNLRAQARKTSMFRGNDKEKEKEQRSANIEMALNPGDQHLAAIQAARAQFGNMEEQLDIGGLELDDLQMALVGVLLTMAGDNDIDGMTRLITKKGVNPEAADYDGRTALHVAASEGAVDAVRLLLENFSVNVNKPDRFEFQPLDDALKGSTPLHAECAQIIRSHGGTSGQKAQMGQKLREFAAENELGAARTILESVNREEVAELTNSHDYDQRTALHIAVQSKNLEMVRLLMDFEGNMHKPDRFGLTPYDYAKRGAPRIGEDPVLTFLTSKLSKEEREKGTEHEEPSGLSCFTIFFLLMEAIIIVMFGFLLDYDRFKTDWHDGEDLTHFYPIYQDVHVMIFIGFGYLMTFLRKNAYQSVGMTFFLCAFVIQWYCLAGPFFQGWIVHYSFDKILINMNWLVRADFCAGSVMIAYGVLLGKLSPFALIVMAAIQVIFYAMNEAIGIHMQISDVGGSMVIHLFGAVFGLTVSWIQMRNPLYRSCAYNNENNSAGYHADIFSMVGTIFLWLFWPTFNSYTALGDQQGRAVSNTVLSLTGSCICAFLFSHMLRKDYRFCMVDIQNATLAGGVAIGASADMYLYPGTAMAIGAIAGTVSTLGFVKFAPILETYIGIHDTCGVNNLHGMPSFIGAIASMIAAYYATVDDYGVHGLNRQFPARCTDAFVTNTCLQGRSASAQADQQLAYCATTIAMALAGGILAGFVVTNKGFDNDFKEQKDMFRDDRFWETPSQEHPYYFDFRGEIKRKEDAVAIAVREESEELAKHRDRLDHMEAALKTLQTKSRTAPAPGGFPQPIFAPPPQQSSSGNVDSELAAMRNLMSKILQKLDKQ
jgi:ammonium transporter Rh